jgi:hypothetical protein
MRLTLYVSRTAHRCRIGAREAFVGVVELDLRDTPAATALTNRAKLCTTV